jgi:hypothetical protein
MGNLVAFYELVAAEWRKRGVPLMPPASESTITGLFCNGSA